LSFWVFYTVFQMHHSFLNKSFIHLNTSQSSSQINDFKLFVVAEHKNILFRENVATFFPFSHTTRLSELVLNVLILNIGKVRIIIFWLCSMSQWEASIQVTWPVLTNQRPVFLEACGNIDPAHVYMKKSREVNKIRRS